METYSQSMDERGPGHRLRARVISPSRSLALVSLATREAANAALGNLGIDVYYARHAEVMDQFASSSIEERLEDLHAAFLDASIDLIFSSIGGFNSNQLLPFIDYSLVSRNPKPLCGYSDITAIQNAIYAQTGMITYSGPHYSTFGQKAGCQYTSASFAAAVLSDAQYILSPAREWYDDQWWIDQSNLVPVRSDGFWVINQGEAEGPLVGGNLCTLNLLQGTAFMPPMDGAVIFLEDDEQAGALSDVEFDRNLQSLLQVPSFELARGLLIGRFQKASEMTRQKLSAIVATKRELRNLPVIANVDFGHTDPKATLPIGAKARISATGTGTSIEVLDRSGCAWFS